MLSMSLIENLKEAADLAKKLGNIDLYKKIVELEGEIIEVTRQKLHLESKVEELQKQLSLKARMSFSQPFYCQEGDPVPFCPRCYEKETIAGAGRLQRRGLRQEGMAVPRLQGALLNRQTGWPASSPGTDGHT
jgi:hypothetical protein